MEKIARIPPWIKVKVPGGAAYVKVRKTLGQLNLYAVCTQARCPNVGHCFCNGTATFLMMGNICTRDCKYCAVLKGIPTALDCDEPRRIAEAVQRLNIAHAVITSVTRDDVPDGGAKLFAEAVSRIRQNCKKTTVEILVPDFLHARFPNVEDVFQSHPDVFGHNIEVVKRLFSRLRPHGDYAHSIALISRASAYGLVVKSGLMIGFGECMDDIKQTLADVRDAGAVMVTIGQYLQSHRGAHPVVKYYHPDEFEEIRQIALSIGFEQVLCGPLVRSSYRAWEMIS
ncbi:MAG: lipoyl synthase [Spirochaetes bacterium]|nr:lipoyl synthase [Spirochaetota bacterium]